MSRDVKCSETLGRLLVLREFTVFTVPGYMRVLHMRRLVFAACSIYVRFVCD